MDDEACPECGEMHTGPCATLADWWESLPAVERDRIVREELAAMEQNQSSGE